MRHLFCFLVQLVFPLVAYAQVQVGIGVPLSGDGAWMGENVLRGVHLYLKQNNIPADEVLKVEDISFSQGQTATGISAVRKLVDVDKVSALILCNSQVVNASSAFIDDKRIPTVAIVGAETATDKMYQVRLWPRPDDEMSELAEYFKGKRIAVLYSEQDSMIARKDSFKKIAGSISDIVYSSPVESDSVSTIALRVKQVNPDAVIFFLMPGKNGILAKKLREIKYEGTFVGSVVINGEEEIASSARTLIGALFPDTFMTDEFIKSYKLEYGHSPGVGAAPGYDAAKLLFEGLRQAGGDQEKLNKSIHAESFTGAMGTYGLLTDGSNSFKVSVTLRKVEG
jgi:branched-chain amino acid transport system substrate-binding protein